MPDKRAHRGPDPRDDEAFGRPTWPALREAVADLSWLFGRGLRDRLRASNWLAIVGR